MKTIAVIKHLDVLDHITSRIAPSTINYIGSPFGFQTVKETLRNSIIPAIALSTHPADHAIDTQELPVITVGILACRGQSDESIPFPFSVANKPSKELPWQAMPSCCCSSPNRQLFSNTDRLPPPDTDILLWSTDRKCRCTTRHRVDPPENFDSEDLGQVMLAVRRYSELPAALYRYAGFFHQVAGTMPAHIMPLRTESFGCSAGAIRAPGFAVDLPNF